MNKMIQIAESANSAGWVMHALDEEGNIYETSSFSEGKWVKVDSPLKLTLKNDPEGIS